MRKLLFSAVAFAALAGQAFAGDWTGFYVGGQGGAGFGDVRGKRTAPAPTPTPAPAPPKPKPIVCGAGQYVNNNGVCEYSPDFGSHQTTGLLGGVIGYNYQIGQFVLGLEGDAGGVLGGSHTVPLTAGGSPPPAVRTLADIRGRLGYAIADRALLYVAGGAAFGDQKTAYSTLAGAPIASFDNGRTGWTIGGGLDYAFTNNWVGRVEYRYTDLGANTYYLVPVTTYDRVRDTGSAVLVGLMYKFATRRLRSSPNTERAPDLLAR